MRRRAAVLATIAVIAAGCADDESGSGATSGSGPATVRLTPVAPVDTPTAMAVREGDPTLYVAEQGGRVMAVRDGTIDEDPVLDLSTRTELDGEKGLLGIAFSNDGSKLYVDYTDIDDDIRVDEFEMGERTADPESGRKVLGVDKPQANHNGGQLVMRPDGLLHIALGDGGGADDRGDGHAREGNGQSLRTLLGKLLRIDPRRDGSDPYTVPDSNPFADGGGRPEIWAYGLRNPWRFSFDRETGDLWIADVGQHNREEIDFVAGGDAGGANFGWPLMEGTTEFRGAAPDRHVAPIFEYPTGEGCAVTGGFVYRGSRVPALRGAYVFADYCGGTVRAIRQEDGRVVSEDDLGVEAANIASFGEDADGELYVLSQGEGLLRIDPA